MNALLEKVRAARRVYLVGNGGSHVNADHIANDLQGCGIRAHVLSPAFLTATANDLGYEFIYSRWIILHGEPGDLLIALSGSGKSPNILNAIVTAKAKGMTTYGVFGAYNKAWDKIDGQVVLDICSLGGNTMQEAEQYQLAWAHEIMLSLRK